MPLKISKYIKTHLLLSYIFFIFLYATIYYILGENHMSRKLSFIDSVYFSATTFTTVGYGDIYPDSDFAKIICITQQIILVLLVTALF